MNKGRDGEDLVCEYLSGIGWEILQRNYRTPRAEIDIIALDDDEIVFVEVKRWDTLEFDSIEYGITRRKRERIISCSKYYLADNEWYQEKSVRYDVVFHKGCMSGLEHIRNAFTETGIYD
ncbi:MAG: YraN family protein [Spirochaetales bacterium]|nr:YraN family protein [Spirochaetales bacterium]